VLDSFVALLGALPEDAPTTPKQLDKARQALERLGATGDLVAKVTEEDGTSVASERIPRKGSALSVTGIVGSPILAAGGMRLFPVQVEGRAVVLLRAPMINAAPPKGRVFAGGVCAGISPVAPLRRRLIRHHRHPGRLAAAPRAGAPLAACLWHGGGDRRWRPDPPRPPLRRTG
jgi:hypothetical protein